MKFVSAWKVRKSEHRFANLQTRQQAVNRNSGESANERKAVEVPLPITMHTGQIIMLTKMFTASDLRFYEFEDDVPVYRWQAPASGSP